MHAGARSVDPFSRKEWYDVKAPSIFAVRNAAKTCVNRTQGTPRAIGTLSRLAFE